MVDIFRHEILTLLNHSVINSLVFLSSFHPFYQYIFANIMFLLPYEISFRHVSTFIGKLISEKLLLLFTGISTDFVKMKIPNSFRDMSI